jgi:predicted nucleic-acid-binding protein
LIALDTNILARYVLFDDPVQVKAVQSLIAGLSVETPGFVCREVVLELVWLLERGNRFGRTQVTQTIQALLDSKELVFEAADRVALALLRYASGGPGFADQMILLAARDAGATLATFDSDLARQPGATPVPG